MARRVVAEALGTALLLAAVVGSVIMGEQVAGGNIRGSKDDRLAAFRRVRDQLRAYLSRFPN